MLDHVSIGVRDIKAAKHFYDAALKPLGYTCLHDFDGSLGYGGKTASF
jgi:catechol 2,3-dioxygenase-like lactoylglutathione lyase family enzyme